MTNQSGFNKIEINAKRGLDASYPPVMELWLGNVKQARWTVNSTDYAAYKWNGYWNGSDKIDVVYVDGDGTGGNTSDLFVDSVKVNNFTRSAEDASTIFDKGSYSQGCFDNTETEAGQEQHSDQGALRFQIPVAQAQPLTRMLGYDYCNRVTSITENGQVSTYGYNPSGQRVTKVEGTPATTTYYFFANYELEVTAGQQTQILYYYVNGQQIAQRKITSTTDTLLYIHKDHLGSAVRLTDTEGAVVQSLAYDPFGFTVYSGGVSETTNQYTGQKKDSSGLYYYGARYYDPELGRFISPDTVLDGLNRYAYCGNNPINYVDPTGNKEVVVYDSNGTKYTTDDGTGENNPGTEVGKLTGDAKNQQDNKNAAGGSDKNTDKPTEGSGINGIDVIPPAPMPDEKINRNDPDPRTIGNTDSSGPNEVPSTINTVTPSFVSTYAQKNGSTNNLPFNEYPLADKDINSADYHSIKKNWGDGEGDYVKTGLKYSSDDSLCVDLMGEIGNEYRAIGNGRVAWITTQFIDPGNYPICGNGITIDYQVGNKTYKVSISHMDQPANFAKGEDVKKGDLLGVLGATGKTPGGPHAHIQVSVLNRAGKWEAIPIHDAFPKR